MHVYSVWVFYEIKDRSCSLVEILPNINCHEDLLRLTDEKRIQLCEEIREFLIANVSNTGGHLASNLGVVELTVALETVFDTGKDRLVFDVGHQSYVHKLLTGRRDAFPTLRQFGGLSGFPKPNESDTDAFVAGHASSSVSIALGMARARTLLHQDYQVVALLGDGAATGGMVYEGLNDAADSGEPIVFVLNDNEMSIGRSVGGISHHFSKLRSNEKYLGMKRWYRRTMYRIPGGKKIYLLSSRAKNRIKHFLLQTTIFENMGLKYYGPVDGHDVKDLISVLRAARDIGEPTLVHVVTKKGKGYAPAEEDPAKYHGIGKFDPVTGKKLTPKSVTFSDSFGAALVSLAAENPRICAITAAMPGGTGLLDFMNRYPERYFDVGIAEEHAVSMAGGLAKQGMIPVFAVYSTFLQRAYDQMMQDIALLHLHVVLAIDRAGLVGDDGPTHHGVFDVGFLRQIPGMRIFAPASLEEQKQMLAWAIESNSGPIALRYPRGTEGAYKLSAWDGQAKVFCHKRGQDATLISYGTLINAVLEASEILEKDGIACTVLRMLELSDISGEEILSDISEKKNVFVIEETAENAGIEHALAWELRRLDDSCSVYGRNLGRKFVPHGSIQQLYKQCGLDADSIAHFVNEVLKREK